MKLRSPWLHGTTHLLFDGIELLEKLAAITPRPRINLLVYHGVLAPRARWRSRVTSYGRPHPPTDPDAPETQPATCAPVQPTQPHPSKDHVLPDEYFPLFHSPPLTQRATATLYAILQDRAAFSRTPPAPVAR